MKIASFLHSYEFMVDQADRAFHKMKEEYDSKMACTLHCCDCCHAVFGLFLVEAANLRLRFDQLHRKRKKEVLLRCSETERGLKRLEKKLEMQGGDEEMQTLVLARERIRCPLLDENQECVLYDHRPITCRVYGIPTRIQGKARVCGKAKFDQGISYPLFDLDGVYRSLYALSRELLTELGGKNPEKATLLISVPRALSATVDELIRETFV
jgi:Fe-S-cluster containining protein